MKFQFTWIKSSLQIFVLIILLIVTTVVFIYLDKELDSRMSRLKADILVYLEKRLNHKISYRSISPSIFMYLEIRDLVIYNDTDTEIFTLKMVRISYNIFRLIMDRDPLKSVSAVEIANTLLQFNLDNTVTENTTPRPGEALQQLNSLLNLLKGPYNFVLKGNKVDVILMVNGMNLELTSLFFDIRDKSGDFDFKINKADVKLDIGNFFGRPFQVSSNIRLNGIVADQFRYSDLLINIQSLASNYVNFGKQTLQVIYNNNRIEVRKIQDKAAIDLLVIYDLNSGLLTTNFLTENFNPVDVVQFTGPLRGYEKYLNIKITCNGGLSFTPGKDDLYYTFKGNVVPDKSMAPVELEISSELTGNIKKVNFDHLFVKTGIGSFEFVGNLLFENLFPEGFLELFNVQAMPGKAVNAAFNVIRKTNGLSLRGSRFAFDSAGFDLFNVDIYPKKNSLLFDLEASLAGISPDDLFKTHGTIVFGKQPELDFTGSLTHIPINMIYKFAMPRKQYRDEMFNDLAPYLITTDFTFTPRQRSFAFGLDGMLTDRDFHPFFKGTATLDLGNYLTFGVAGKFDQISLPAVYKLLVRGNDFSGEIFNGLLPYHISADCDLNLHLASFSPDMLNDLPALPWHPGADSLGLTLDGYLADDTDHKYFKTRGMVNLGKQVNISLNGNVNDVPAETIYRLLAPEDQYSLYTYENLKKVLVTTDFQLNFNFADFADTLPLLQAKELADINFYLRKNSLNLSLDSSLSDMNQNVFFAGHTDFHYADSFEVDMTGSLTGLPLDFVYKLLLPQKDFSEKIYAALSPYHLSSTFRFFTDQSRFKLTSGYVKLEDLDKPVNYLQCELNISNEEFSFNKINAGWFGINLLGKFTGTASKTGTVQFKTSLEMNKIPYNFSGIYAPDNSLFIKGNYGFYFNAGMAKNGDFVFHTLAQSIPLPVKFGDKDFLNFSFIMNGLYTQDGQLKIVSPRIIVYDLPLLDIKKNTLQFACTVNNSGAVISDAVYIDTVSVVRGTGNVIFPGDEESDRSYLEGILNLNNKYNDETYKIDIKLFQEQIDVLISFNSAPLDRLGDLIIKGSVSGNARLSGDGEQPDLYVNFQLDKAKISSDIITMAGELDVSRESIDIHSFSCNYLDHRITNATAFVNFPDGACTAKGNYSYTFFKKNITADLVIKGKVENIDPIKYTDSIWLNDFTASVAFQNILVDDAKFNPWAINLNRDWNEIFVSGGPGNAFKALIDLRGNFNLKVSEPFPVRTTVAGRLENNQIYATVKDLWLDLKILNVMLGKDMLQFVDGYGVGQDIIIQGPINDPDYIGSGRVNDVKLSFFLIPEVTEPFSSNILFDKKIISLINARAQIGKGAILANGALEIDHWFPRSYDISVQTDTTKGVHFAYEFEPIIVDGYAIGQVRARATEFDIWVDGTLKVVQCNLQMNTKRVEKKEEDEDAANLFIDLDFIAGNNVQFHLPTVTLPLINCYASQGSKLHCSFDSQKDELELTGKVLIQGGEVFYFDRSFFLKSGYIVFNEKGGMIDPRLTVDAEIKEIDKDGETVTISMSVQDKRLSEFEPYFRSYPYKSQDEIMAILSGSISEKITEAGLSGFVLLSSDIASQYSFLRPLEKSVRDALKLDMFSIRMPIMKNIIKEQLIHDEPLPPGNSSTVLSRYFDNTTISLGKYLGTNLFLSLMVRLRDVESLPEEDFTNFNFLGLVSEPEIGLEWETPFFNLEYLFTPKLNHINDLFLQDMALKFEKSFSF